MKGLFLFFLLIAASGSSLCAGGKHEVHLSLCELRINDGASTIDVPNKIFTDLLEQSI